MTDVGPDERRLLGALPDGLILVQGDDVTYSNPAAGELLGTSVPDSVNRLTPTALTDLIERAAAGSPGAQTFERGTPARWIEAVAHEPLDEGSVLVVLRDVTERRTTDAIRRDFVANASHELKTPVASIQAAAETLVRALDDDPETARHFALQVWAAAGRLSQMVTDLLDLSRLESERPETEDVKLESLVRKEVDRVADRAEVDGINLAVETQPLLARANRRDVRLAVRNLLDNALAYTEQGGTVTISLAALGEEVVVSVSDTGVGIPGRDMPRIFERFYRVDDARNRETGGTGLGLAIVRHVAEEHGGRVEAESELGLGSTFRLLLPIAPT